VDQTDTTFLRGGGGMVVDVNILKMNSNDLFE